MSAQRSLAKKARHRPFDFDQYYPRIQNHTSSSTIQPFSPDLAQACVNYYQARFNGRRHLFCPQDAALLVKLEATLDQYMVTSRSDGFFLRMTNRSPKDGMPLDSGALRRNFLVELGEKDSECSGDELMGKYTPNDIMVAFSGAVSSALRVRNGREAMCLLLTSERVYMDLNLALDCSKHADDEWDTWLILREWDSNLRHDWEFRCFVNQGHLYAITQYNHYCYFRDLAAECAEDGGAALKQHIIEYWHSVKADLECEAAPDYVFDVARLADGRWCVVELNPYATDTGGCLYRWKELNELQSSLTADGCDIRVKKQGNDSELADFVEACVMPQLGREPDSTQEGEFVGPWDSFLPLSEPQLDLEPQPVPAQAAPRGAGCCIS